MRKFLLVTASALALASMAHAQTVLQWGLGTGAQPQTVTATDRTGANVPAGTLNSTTHQYNLGVINLNGGAGASATTFWRGDGTWATVPVPPPTNPVGPPGALQYDNGGVFGGVGGAIYCTACGSGSQPLLAFTALPTSFSNETLTFSGANLVFSNGVATPTNWMSFGNNSTGGQITFAATGYLNWTNNSYIGSPSAGVMAVGLAPGASNGTLQLGTLHLYTQWSLTDASNNVIASVDSQTAKFLSNVRFGNSPTNPLYPTPTTAGLSSISQGRFGSGQGLNIAGTSNGGGLFCDPMSPYCMGRQVDFWSGDDGFQVFGIENGVSDHHGLELGLSRSSNNMQEVSQLLPLDQVFPPGAIRHFNITNGGSGYTFANTHVALTPVGCSRNPSSNVEPVVVSGAVTGLSVLYDPGEGCASVAVNITGDGTGATATASLTAGATDASVGMVVGVSRGWYAGGPAWVGFGQADLKPNRLRLGGVNDSGHPWATSVIQPTLALSAPLEWDRPNAGAEAGFTNDFSIRDVAGLMTITKWDNSAAAGVSAQFLRSVPVTVAGLATADPSPAHGDRAYVNDATSCAFAAPVSGGGTTECPVYYDGAWKGG
jgi:hypothetical protein